MSQNRTVCFRGKNLESVISAAQEKGVKPNELINIAVEQYLKSLKQKQS